MRRSALAPALAFALALPLAGCIADAPAPALERAEPRIDPLAFFEGRTRGEGVLTPMMGDPRRIDVRGKGTRRPDGSLVLDQTVSLEGEPPRTRQWVLRQTGPDEYRGTLTDAKGEVIGRAEGNRLRLTYTLRDRDLEVDQYLYLQPGGQALLNRMTLSKWGMANVARLEETIRRVD